MGVGCVLAGLWDKSPHITAWCSYFCPFMSLSTGPIWPMDAVIQFSQGSFQILPFISQSHINWYWNLIPVCRKWSPINAFLWLPCYAMWLWTEVSNIQLRLRTLRAPREILKISRNRSVVATAWLLGRLCGDKLLRKVIDRSSPSGRFWKAIIWKDFLRPRLR